MEYIPAEIVLEIIEHFKKNTHVTKFECSECTRFGEICNKHHQKLLTFQAQKIIAAKNFREVNKSFSGAYNPRYITLNIGGSFGRLQHREIILFNTRMWDNTLDQIHNRRATENKIKHCQYARNESRFLPPKNLTFCVRTGDRLTFDNEKVGILKIKSQGGQKSRHFYRSYVRYTISSHDLQLYQLGCRLTT
jgi:hypothetical protein